MREFKDLVQLRRSIRKFTAQPLDANDIATIMRAALMSPSSKGKRSAEFILVDNKIKLSELSNCKAHGGEPIREASLAVIIVASPEKSDAWIEDCSVAAMQLMLQAEDLGIGSCWIQFRDRKDADGRDAEHNVRTLLNIPADRRVLCVIALGYKGMERKLQNEECLLWHNVHTGQW